MNVLKTFGLAVATVKALGCAPAEMPTPVDVSTNAMEIRQRCSETSSEALNCAAFDVNGNPLFVFDVACPPPPGAGAFYGDVNPKGKPLHHPDIQKRLRLAEGGLSCEPL